MPGWPGPDFCTRREHVPRFLAYRDRGKLVGPRLFAEFRGAEELVDGDEDGEGGQHEPQRAFDNLFVANVPGVFRDHNQQ